MIIEVKIRNNKSFLIIKTWLNKLLYFDKMQWYYRMFDSMGIWSQYLNKKGIIKYYVQYDPICGKICFYSEKRLEEYTPKC